MESERGTTEETLRSLESRLLQASLTAERLIREAAGRAARADRGGGRYEDRAGQSDADSAESADASARGNQSGDRDGSAHLRPQDLELLTALWDRMSDLVPPELQRRVAEAMRELLLALRALIDWQLERLERGRPEPPEVKDIPIV